MPRNAWKAARHTRRVCRKSAKARQRRKAWETASNRQHRRSQLAYDWMPRLGMPGASLFSLAHLLGGR